MISCAAFVKLNGAFPETKAACCNVLIVSNGANKSFEQPAARPLAKLFLNPLIHAASCDLFKELFEANIMLLFVFLLILLPELGPLRCWRFCGNKDGVLEETIVLESMSIVTTNSAPNWAIVKHFPSPTCIDTAFLQRLRQRLSRSVLADVDIIISSFISGVIVFVVDFPVLPRFSLCLLTVIVWIVREMTDRTGM